MRARNLIFSLFLGMALRAGDAPGSPTATPVRSLVTASAGLTDPGALVLELGGTQAYGRDGTRQGGVTPQFDLGLSPWVDLRCGWNAQVWRQDSPGQGHAGPGDPYLGGQVLVARQDRAGADLGLVYSHLLPRASVEKGLSSGSPEDTLLLAASRSMGPWGLDANVGFHWAKDPGGDQRESQRLGSFAITYAPAAGWNVSLDTYLVGGSALGDRDWGHVLAASYDASQNLKLDLSVGHGWAEASPRLVLRAGLMYRIAKLW